VDQSTLKYSSSNYRSVVSKTEWDLEFKDSSKASAWVDIKIEVTAQSTDGTELSKTWSIYMIEADLSGTEVVISLG
jgi:hypothetical protein